MEIREFDHRRARPEEYAALAVLLDRLHGERDPDDPLVPLEERIRRWQTIPPHVVQQNWTVAHPERPGEIIAYAQLTFQRVEHNRHAADFSIGVAPEFRRRGLGSRLLTPLVAAAEPEGRTLLLTATHSTVPEGEPFMRRLGATMGLPLHINQLDVRDVDRELLRRWQERARERASGFELVVWEGRVPDEHVKAFVELQGAMNLAPRGDLRLEDFHVTPERFRLHEQAEGARGDRRWRIAARERSNRALVGYTEVIWHPNRPELLQQGDTAVMPAHQNRGLGRWLKAAMLEKVVRERPEVRFVRTGNAYVNEPMLKINQELGFRPYRSIYIWQIEVSQVEACLEARR